MEWKLDAPWSNKKDYQSFSSKFHYGLNQSSHLYGQLEMHKNNIKEIINALLQFGWFFFNLCVQKRAFILTMDCPLKNKHWPQGTSILRISMYH